MIQTKTTGMFQGDLLVRGALTAALKDLRANPWLLDFAFAGVPQDGLTVDEYGEADVARAKEWFMRTQIPVRMMPRNSSPPTFPCITVRLSSEAEAEVTLADINYEPTEYNDEQPPLTAPFDPVSYDPATGIMVLPPQVPAQLVVSAGQLVVDRSGVQHPILDSPDEATAVLAKDVSADFHGAFVVGRKPGSATQIESVSERASFLVGVHVQGEPAHLLYLHSIVKFVLYVYKQALLERRGFERTSFSSSDFERNAAFEDEAVFSRYVTLNGYSRQFWPKGISPTVSGTVVFMAVSGAGKTSLAQVPSESLFIGDGDPEESDILASVR